MTTIRSRDGDTISNILWIALKRNDNPTTAQQACQDDLIKSQRQGSSVTLDALLG
ncbi:hypothetical protein [Marinomonas sp. BSi20584]|uniref:hypothetical protein n=1 Tax=Marinomonas sp. BSi20584 TaxID=1594462 RepID=UPI001E648D59|nr:hypothetical protein [Marinomonas sp. BSi20584]